MAIPFVPNVYGSYFWGPNIAIERGKKFEATEIFSSTMAIFQEAQRAGQWHQDLSSQMVREQCGDLDEVFLKTKYIKACYENFETLYDAKHFLATHKSIA